MSTEESEGKSRKKAAPQRTSQSEQQHPRFPSTTQSFSYSSQHFRQRKQQHQQQQAQKQHAQPSSIPEPRTPQQKQQSGDSPLLSEGQGITTPSASHHQATGKFAESASAPASATAQLDQPSESTSPLTPETPAGTEGEHQGQQQQQPPRQVIAVSASKGPAAFFNLARKFLVTDEMCDLSALEGAIVSAVDAAHLLERSKLATIVRVQTSYVAVEPRRRKAQQQQQTQQGVSSSKQPEASQPGGGTGDFSFVEPIAPPTAPAHPPQQQQHHHPQQGRGNVGAGGGTGRHSGAGSSGGAARERELRRARIVITVKRTENYKLWLEENPLQAILAGDGEGDDVEGIVGDAEDAHEES